MWVDLIKCGKACNYAGACTFLRVEKIFRFFLGFCPDNKYHLIPNPDTAPVVKRIFAMAVSGLGTARIAKALRDDGILCPNAYNSQVLGINRTRTYKDDNDWAKTTVAQIVRNWVYLGHTVSQKASTISFKNKTRIKYPEEDFITVLNTHESLVEQGDFDVAQKIFKIKNRKNKHDFDNIFVGILKCSDCGSGLSIQFPSNGNGRPFFSYSCNRYRQHSKYCTTHYIRYDEIYKIVLEGIQEKQRLVNEHRNELAVYAQKLADRGGDVQSIMRFFELVRKHEQITELTPEILHEFLESVVVYQAEGKRLDRTQKMVMNFRFIKDEWFEANASYFLPISYR